MKKYLLVVFIASCATPKILEVAPQTFVQFEMIKTLTAPLTESSGLTTINDMLYTHNDSGDTPTLYVLDTLGALKRATTFKNLKNTDWEGITNDANYVYVGDFGNNLGTRKDLTIYKIAMTDLENPDAIAQKITFNYDTQTNFTARNRNHGYDLETIIAINDHLILFSKDWTTQQTTIYKVPKEAGDYTLRPQGTIPVNNLITDAAYNGKNRIVLCGYDNSLQPYIFILEITKTGYKLQERIKLPIEASQIEAITFLKTTNGLETYYLTSEAVNIKLGDEEAKTDGAFYRLEIRS